MKFDINSKKPVHGPRSHPWGATPCNTITGLGKY